MADAIPDFDNLQGKKVLFVSTRIAGTDGVSLEIAKWTKVIEGAGVECYFLAGECDRPTERSFVIEEMHFEHPEIIAINQQAFGSECRTPELNDRIMQMARRLREKLREVFSEIDADAVIAQNCLTIPMNIPLGVALVQAVQEHGISCVAHHHDFFWERDRFLVSAVDDLLNYAFPPPLPQIQHVVINSIAGQEFSRRTGLSCRIIPNVMDFENRPETDLEYAKEFRRDIGIPDKHWLILQPTRVVPRKGIERSIELVHRLGPERATLVITHASGDEGDQYKDYLCNYAELMGVTLCFADQQIGEKKGRDSQGRNIYTIHDAYTAADLVAYPSDYEGFGNAFLEAIYYEKPVVCNRYAIFRTDIEPCDFKVVAFDGFLTQETVEQTERVLTDAAYRADTVQHNYRIANQFFSYQAVEEELRLMLSRPQNIYRLLARRRAFV